VRRRARRKGFVHQQQRRVDGQRPRQPDALAHAAGQLVRVAIRMRIQPDLFQHGAGTPYPFGTIDAGQFEAEGRVVDHGAVRQQRERLEHHRHAVAPQALQLLRFQAPEVAAVDEDFASRRRDQAVQQAQQRGFAAAGQPHQDADAAVRHVQRDAVEGSGPHAASLPPLLIDFAYLPQGDFGAGHGCSR
jgi:hypothetical protein